MKQCVCASGSRSTTLYIILNFGSSVDDLSLQFASGEGENCVALSCCLAPYACQATIRFKKLDECMTASWLRDMAVHVQAAGAMPDETDRYGKIPVRLEKRLMAFQREGVKFALRHGGRALIGDEMGLGKTVQVM